jgi:hypothetical protein
MNLPLVCSEKDNRGSVVQEVTFKADDDRLQLVKGWSYERSVELLCVHEYNHVNRRAICWPRGRR